MFIPAEARAFGLPHNIGRATDQLQAGSWSLLLPT
jgi:hypothetical protein